MRFLGIGNSCDLGSLYLRLIESGHEVKVAIADPLCHGTLAGLVERTDDWRPELAWVRAAGDDGIVLFENVAEGSGALQDALRAGGLHVIGGSAYGDRLENDRAFGQSVLAGLGLLICPTWNFEDVGEALAFLESEPGRYVLKFNGHDFASSENYVGRLADGRDLAAMLRAKRPRIEATGTSFVLMRHAEGIEMGVGAYFDGARFLTPACLDWEHKRFFPHDMGELTGEMGTVATYHRTGRFFGRTLRRMEPLLRENGYCGYINLNTIVNEDGIWPLEFTCRFGYPGFAILDPLQDISWAELFRALVRRSHTSFPTRPGFSTGIVMTIPPFPYDRREFAEPVGLPLLIEGEIGPEERRHLHYGEVGLEAGQLVTSGLYGWSLVVTGTGPTIAEAKSCAYALADRVFIPNLRYRRDIGDRLMAGDLARVERLGLLGDAD